MGACLPANTPSSTTSIHLATNTPVATDIQNTATVSSTETAINPPATRTPGPISSIPGCTKMEVQNAIPADYQISGSMLSVDRQPWSPYSGRNFGKKPSSLYRYDLSARIETFLINVEDYQKHFQKKIKWLEVEDLSVSPDFLKAVYIVDAYVDESDWDPKRSWLEIYDASTNQRTTIPWKDEWTYIVGWVNKDYFVIRAGSSMLFLDASGSIKEQFLSPKYPDYANPRVYNPTSFVIWGGYRIIDGYAFDSQESNLASMFLSKRSQARVYNPTLEVYNPSLEYLIYTEVKDQKAGVVLYDLKKQQKVTEIITSDRVKPTAFGGMPVWSPNGDSAVMLLRADRNLPKQALFLLNVSGKVEQLTKFEVLGPYNWSPDGKFIAFWLANGSQIGILDTTTRKLRTFCISGGYSNGGGFPLGVDGIPTSGDLVWLPNNKQLLVETFKVSDEVQYEGIGVADLEKSLFIELKWNARFPVWLKQ